MSTKKVCIIGAGAAGMAAAVKAAQNGACVTVLEHMEEPLKKLLLTGNGRCNFSNTDVSPVHYHGDRSVIEKVIGGCTCDDLLDFMESIHVEPLEVHYRFGENGYFYPSTNKASTVRDALIGKVSELGVRLLTRCRISGISQSGGSFLIRYIQDDPEEVTEADSVIFAAGSNAAPQTGSDSSIYKVLKSLSVPFHTFLPALCAVRSDSSVLKKLAGLRADGKAVLEDITCNTMYETDPGEVQFNEHSVSGIPVMQLSRFAAIGKKAGHEMNLHIDLYQANNRDRILPLEKVTLNVTGTDGFQKAVCCTGGVPGNAVDPETLMFRDIPGIYFAGELLDIDGDCGGYNLHFAFASGLRAGNYASL